MFNQVFCRRPAGSYFRITMLLLVPIVLSLSLAASGLADSSVIQRVSLDSGGTESPEGVSWAPAVSRDGRHVAFMSTSETLVPGDGNTQFDIFLRDTLTGATTRVSTNSAGEEATGFSWFPSISDDGRYVTFLSTDENLVADDTNGTVDIFVKDTLTGTTSIASRGMAGIESNGISEQPSISGNGRYVAFVSEATSLVAGDTNGKKDVFVKDMQGGGIIMVSTDYEHGAADGDSTYPDLNQDGTWVVFNSDATDIVEGDTNAQPDVFVKNTMNGARARVSTDANGVEADNGSVLPSINDNGHYVAFQSLASNLMEGDTNGQLDIYVKYLETGEMWRASTDAGGNETSGSSVYASISGDGNYVAFRSGSPDLVPDDLNGATDIFVKHLASDSIQRVSVDPAGVEANNPSDRLRISGDGRFVALESYARNLVTDDTNNTIDIFLAPVGRHYLFTWYDNQSARDWLLMGNSSRSATDRWFHATVAGEEVDLPQQEGYVPGQVAPGTTGFGFYDIMGGPVDVTSRTGKEALVSQRIVWGDYSLDEYLGLDTSHLSDVLYWTWYDQLSAGYLNWILISNPNALPVYVEISIGGQLREARSIPAGESVTPSFPGVMGGPVKVQAWTDASKTHPAYVMGSQRVLSNDGAAFNEEVGIPERELSDHYLWTWYDQSSPGFRNWVLIANENPEDVYYQLRIAGSLVDDGVLSAGESITPSFPGVMGGPVELQAWFEAEPGGPAPVIASQRVIAGPSFEETPGFQQEAVSYLFEWTWYDQQSPGMTNWVLVSNPNSQPVFYDIIIGGETVQSAWLDEGQSATATFPGLMSGPVEVEAYTSGSRATSAPVFASQRALFNGHFNEVIGKPREPLPLL